MANWVDQDLHVVGRKTDIDRFIRTGVRRQRGGDEVLRLHKLCPPRGGVKRDPYQPAEAIVLNRLRTRTQALFSMQTRNVLPETFYQALPKRWPELSFAAGVNEEMGNFGGVVIVLGGKVTNLVLDYGPDYDRRSHAREVRRIMKAWGDWLTLERPWSVDPKTAVEPGSLPFDAHFDDDFRFFLRTREEAAAFRARFGGGRVMRRVEGKWRRARVVR